jgi:hypothetical protein
MIVAMKSRKDVMRVLFLETGAVTISKNAGSFVTIINNAGLRISGKSGQIMWDVSMWEDAVTDTDTYGKRVVLRVMWEEEKLSLQNVVIIVVGKIMGYMYQGYRAIKKHKSSGRITKLKMTCRTKWTRRTVFGTAVIWMGRMPVIRTWDTAMIMITWRILLYSGKIVATHVARRVELDMALVLSFLAPIVDKLEEMGLVRMYAKTTTLRKGELGTTIGIFGITSQLGRTSMGLGVVLSINLI